MNIRRATPSDAKRINDLLFEVARIHAEGRPDIFKSAAKKYSDEELVKIIECEKTPIFVATDEFGYVLGYAFCIYQITEDNILLRDRKTLYIDDICVDKEARRKHVGKSLYDHVLSFAKQEGFDAITLNVWSFNDGAYKFYEKCGMTPLKTVMEYKIK